MNRRPVWRWKGFWLGLCVLAFFGWAWARSMGRNEAVSISGSGLFRSEARVCAGVCAVSQWEGDKPYERVQVIGYSMEFTWEAERIERRWAFLSRDEEEDSTRLWWVAFPMWVSFAGWLAMWGGWMVWRWRRAGRNVWTGMDGRDEIGRG